MMVFSELGSVAVHINLQKERSFRGSNPCLYKRRPLYFKSIIAKRVYFDDLHAPLEPRDLNVFNFLWEFLEAT